MSLALRTVSGRLLGKGGFFNTVPIIVAEAEEPERAQEA